MAESAGSLFRRLGPAGLLGLAWTSCPAIGGILLLANIGLLSDWLTAHLVIGWLLYVIIFIVTAGIGALPTYSQSVLAGWVFGFAAGLPAALLGFVGASMLGYAIARGVSQDRIERIIEERPRARAARAALLGRGFRRSTFIVTLLRLPPNSPFALTNLVLAGSGTDRRAYILGTALGMLPRTAIVIGASAAAAASGARDIQSFVREGPGTLVLVTGLVVTITVLAAIGVIANRAIERVIRGEAPPERPAAP